jgi:hypothetical protein
LRTFKVEVENRGVTINGSAVLLPAYDIPVKAELGDLATDEEVQNPSQRFSNPAQRIFHKYIY